MKTRRAGGDGRSRDRLRCIGGGIGKKKEKRKPIGAPK